MINELSIKSFEGCKMHFNEDAKSGEVILTIWAQESEIELVKIRQG